MKKVKYALIFFITVILFQYILITTSFATDKNNISISSPACVLIESSSGTILYEKNSNEVRYPASTTKIMTAIIVLEKCELTDMAKVSHNAVFSIPPDYVTARLVEGENLSVEDLLNALLVLSANDAAIVLAEHISGSVANFSDLMNEKAKELGCKNTNFVNPNGIHNKNHYSTAYDLALITQYAMKNNAFRDFVKKTKFTLPATDKYKKTDRSFTTTNDLLVKNTSKLKSNYYYPDAIGVKTGYTGEAGNCLVASARRDNMEVISVVLGGDFTKDGLSEKFLDSISLLDYGFNNYSIKNIYEKNAIFKEIEVPGATKESKNLKILVKDGIGVLTENSTDFADLEPEVSIDKLKTPISAGSTVGKISYSINGKTYSSDLIAESDVISSNLLPILLRVSLMIVTLYILYLLLSSEKKKKKRRNPNSVGSNVRKISKNRKH